MILLIFRHQMQNLSLNICRIENLLVSLQQHAYPASRKNSALRVSLFLLCTCKRGISNYYGLRDTVFESWIHSLVYVRNICGHHSRLWNRNLRIQPVTPRRCSHPFITQPVRTNRVYYVMCIIRYLLNVIEPGNNFTSQINWLFIDYPSINKRALYFPNNWETEPLWQ